ncbi:chaperonin 10-like protein [Cladorrhinum sp. PSN332]|nr:chaperonin 10-like protein [Cladorrhinum sp. PSN332]
MTSNPPNPENHAAWIPSKTSHPLQVQPAPFPTVDNLQPNQLIVQTRALAINPVDWFIQKPGNPMFNYLPYPFILGSDVAGTVYSSSSPQFKAGDRVVSHALGQDHRSKNPAEGAFQKFAVVRDKLAAKIPDSLEFKDAAVLPLGLTTAATALFLPRFLGLDFPEVEKERKGGGGQVVLVWGASTSVGSNAVQLARGAGYEVVATAGEKNWGYVKGKLGASEVWDYKSETAVEDIVRWFAEGGKTCLGAVAVGDESVGKCLDVLGEVRGGKRNFVAQVSGSVSIEEVANVKGVLGLLGILGKMVWAGVRMAVKSRLEGVKYGFVWGTDLVDGKDDLCGKVWNEYLPAALASGEYVAAPEALVVGEGLEKVQEGFEVCRRGVSAKKVVVTL